MGFRHAILAAVAALSCACAAPDGGQGPSPSAGARLPAEVVDLARTTMMGGGFVLEIAGDGTILGAEAAVPVSAVPEVCRVAADRHAPGGKTVAAEKEVQAGVTYWEIIKEIEGRRVEVLMHPDGSLAGREDPLRKSDWPAVAVDAGRTAAGGGEVVAVETVSGPEAATGETWHVKVRTTSGEVLRVSVAGNGSVLRVVRKMKAEMRVPK